VISKVEATVRVSKAPIALYAFAAGALLVLSACASDGARPGAEPGAAAAPSAIVTTGPDASTSAASSTPLTTGTVAPWHAPATPPMGIDDGRTKLLSWNFQRNKKHVVPSIPTEASRLANEFGAVYTGPDRKYVYLTFDEGYENGHTPAILDALQRNGVHATFFVTGAYCRDSAAMCRRIVAEGHVVGNHSNTHPSMPKLTTDAAKFDAQFTMTEARFRKATGKPLAKLFRPPMGEYSGKSLAMTRALGYTTVFWSFAHADFDEKKQPPVATTISRVLTGSHPGAIILLHGMSSSDTQALDAIIAGLRKQGYEFGVLSAR
jgi:peptidoglycan-N-acetylmuramic acid deacetylase